MGIILLIIKQHIAKIACIVMEQPTTTAILGIFGYQLEDNMDTPPTEKILASVVASMEGTPYPSAAS